MPKWLQGNPLGTALAAVCGLLLTVMLTLAVMSSLPFSPSLPQEAPGAADSILDLPTLASSGPLDSYSVITERPLFNENRLPVLDEAVDNGGGPPESDADKEKPDVELAGVIITPSLRMVTLKRKDSEHSLVAFEGRPIEADFGSWQVSRVQPREATLTSASGEELQLEMKVHDEAIEPPAPKAKADQPAENAAAGESAETEPLSRAEEIRQRIAERREELRREAEQADGAEQSQEKPQPTSYRDAIQSMVGRNRKKSSDNEH